MCIRDSLTFVITAYTAAVTLFTDGINLVDEDNTRRFFARLRCV